MDTNKPKMSQSLSQRPDHLTLQVLLRNIKNYRPPHLLQQISLKKMSNAETKKMSDYRSSHANSLKRHSIKPSWAISPTQMRSICASEVLTVQRWDQWQLGQVRAVCLRWTRAGNRNYSFRKVTSFKKKSLYNAHRRIYLLWRVLCHHLQFFVTKILTIVQPQKIHHLVTCRLYSLRSRIQGLLLAPRWQLHM